jgi:hypothetical protein
VTKNQPTAPRLQAPIANGFHWTAGCLPLSSGCHSIRESPVAEKLTFFYGFCSALKAASQRSTRSPHPLVQLTCSLNLPAILVGALLSTRLPEWIVDVVVFGVLVLLLWWLVGTWADNELGLGHAQGRIPPPARERTISLACGGTALVLLAIGIIGHTFNLKFLGLFWLVLIPVSILTWAIKWRRHHLPAR